MPFLALDIPPGLNRNGTEYQSRGRWYDSNLVRWWTGTLQPIGGWSRIRGGSPRADLKTAGVPRGAHGWVRNDAKTGQMAIGTNTNLYFFSGSALSDITPAGFTAGSPDTVAGLGYGRGPYGYGGYGIAQVTPSDIASATVWSMDNFGENLLAVCNNDGILYVWQNNPAVKATPVVASRGTVPTGNLGILVSGERFAVALGADGNPRKIRWSDQEDYTAWDIGPLTQAGSLYLTSNGFIRTGRRVRGGFLVFTSQDVHLCNYVGQPYVYGIERVGSACGAISGRSVAMVDDWCVWMSDSGFYTYNGYVQQLPCEIGDDVFSNINRTQARKITAIPNAYFSEIWWHYPRGNSGENDSYVVWNYKENHWNHGTIQRTTGIDKGPYATPIWCDASGYVYQHESGLGWDDQLPFAQSGPVEIGNGERVYMVRRLIPDANTTGDVHASFSTRFYPNDTETIYGPYQPAQPTDVRFTARQVAVKVETVNAVSWRIGRFRFDAIPGGER